MSKDKIIPLLKPASFNLSNAEAVRNLLPEDEIIAQIPVQMPFIADIVINYALLLPDRYEFINEKKLSELRLSTEELHAIAVENLFRLLPEVSIQDLVMYEAILAGDDLEASTLLMTGVWEQLAGDSDGELRMVVPTRDVVYFRNNRVDLDLESGTVSSAMCLDAMLDAARAERDENPSRRVSNCIFAWGENGWRPIGELGKEL